jgi:hypothetical protein
MQTGLIGSYAVKGFLRLTIDVLYVFHLHEAPDLFFQVRLAVILAGHIDGAKYDRAKLDLVKETASLASQFSFSPFSAAD